MLVDTLHITAGDCVAVVGAGGKTSLCWLLSRDLAQRGSRVVFTTTTHIRRPAAGTFDLLQIGEEVSGTSTPWRTACIASAIDGTPDDTRLDESLMPVVHTKLAGFTGEEICRHYHSISNLALASPISLIVEADGARGLMLKAPSEHEPVIPACSTLVCVVANLEALGRPLDEHTAHRPARIVQLTGVQIGEPMTPRLLIDLLAHPMGGLKGIPPAARKAAVLMQRDEMAAHPDGAFIVSELTAHGYDQAIVISPRAAQVHPLKTCQV